MTVLTPSLLVAAANAFVGLGEVGGDNRGPIVELFLREVRQPPGQPWCAAFVHHVGYWSHYDAVAKSSTWPLPPTASCTELGTFAQKRGILLDEPEVGDIFLVCSRAPSQFHHTGVVVSVDACSPVARSPQFAVYSCTTVEGNTNDDGSRNGYTTLRRSRQFNTFVGDRFIRWTNLNSRLRAA